MLAVFVESVFCTTNIVESDAAAAARALAAFATAVAVRVGVLVGVLVTAARVAVRVAVAVDAAVVLVAVGTEAVIDLVAVGAGDVFVGVGLVAVAVGAGDVFVAVGLATVGVIVTVACAIDAVVVNVLVGVIVSAAASTWEPPRGGRNTLAADAVLAFNNPSATRPNKASRDNFIVMFMFPSQP